MQHALPRKTQANCDIFATDGDQRKAVGLRHNGVQTHSLLVPGFALTSPAILGLVFTEALSSYANLLLCSRRATRRCNCKWLFASSSQGKGVMTRPWNTGSLEVQD